jgi:3-deoxy-manno-octulosonate cytidylyltransferase (CMP-KDO synthetase)
VSAIVVIPARYASTRFPGKPLARFAGASLIEHTWKAASRTGLPVIIATDSLMIADEARRFGAKCIVTGAAANGTERCAIVAKSICHEGPVINWQGDSPLVPAHWIPALLSTLAEGDCAVATPVQLCRQEQIDRIKHASLCGEPTATLAVLSSDFRALFFSKAVIPYRGPWWLHVGIYAYQPEALAQYGRHEGILEASEQLEQLRFLERGLTIRGVPVDGPPIWEVNHPADVGTVERMMGERDGSLRP